MTRLDEHRPRADGRYSRRSKLPCRWDCRRALVVLARATRSAWRAGPGRPSPVGRASHGGDPGTKPIAHRLRQARRGLRARPAGPAGRPRGSKSAVFYPNSGKLPVRRGSKRRDAAPRVVRARRRRGFPCAGLPCAGLPGAGLPGHRATGCRASGRRLPMPRLSPLDGLAGRAARDCMHRWNAAVRSRTIVKWACSPYIPGIALIDYLPGDFP